MKHSLTLLALAFATAAAAAQSGNPTPLPQTPSTTTPYQHPEDNRPLRTFTLQTGNQSDANEVLTSIRILLDPDVKVFLTPFTNTISVRATPTQMQLIEKIIAEVNQPRHAYRLTYTITEMDGTKRIGIQNFAVVVAAGGGRTTLKDGSKIPVVTGSNNKQSKEPDTVFTYLDIGLNINASLDEFANGARLQSKIEQSSAAENTTIAGVTEPIIRQSVLEGTSFLTPGKPLTLGAFDIPGSTRHLEVAVTMDPVH